MFKGIIAGQVEGFSPISHREFIIDGHGTFRFTDSNGNERAIPVVGDFARLLKEIYTDVNGPRLSVFGTD